MDADPGTFSASGLPAGLSIDPTSGVISGTIDPRAAGSYTVTVTAADDGAAAITTFSWVVGDTTPPALTNPGAHNSAVGDTVSLATSASGLPSGDTATYSVSGLPAGLAINVSSGVISGIINGKANVYPTTVTVTDGRGASVSQTFTWTVTVLSETNPGTQNNSVGDKVSLSTISASGLPSGDTRTYSATGLPSGLSINKTTGVVSGTVT